MKTYYGVDFEEQKQKLLASKKALPLIKEAIHKADAALDKVYNIDKITDYMSYYETGIRNDVEYFARRNNCLYLGMALWLTDDEKYVKPLMDHIFYICNEYTWCIPAHAGMKGGRKPKVERIIRNVDLFQADTARVLTEVALLVGDKMPYYVLERIEYELRRRVFDAFKAYECFELWEIKPGNWSAVCAGGCAISLLHFGTEEEIEQLLPRLIAGLDLYLKGFKEDGCCREGYAYWRFGFGHYIPFARALYEYSDGKINYLQNEMVRKLAMFPQKIRMTEEKVVSFSDGSTEFKFGPGLLCQLKKVYPEVQLPDLKNAFFSGVAQSMTDLLWFDTEYEADSLDESTAFFEQSQWYIKRCGQYSFAAKGGDNYEPHNHNDIGSFMIITGEEIPIADFGAPRYIKYENNDDRFKDTGFLNFSSRGHSVPIINGKYQCLGSEYKAENVYGDENGFSLDIEGAYEEGLVHKIHRSFSLKEKRVVLKDTFDYSCNTKNIVERFTSWTRPQVREGNVILGDLSIVFDKDKYAVNILNDSYPAHRSPHEMVEVYFIDFIPYDLEQTEFEFEFVVASEA